MSQLEHIEAIEKRLWSAADNLRANSNYASNEYFLPVMGLVFLRHAYSRYLMVKAKIEPNLPSRGGKTRALTKEDFSQQSAIFLRPNAQFDYLVALPDKEDRRVLRSVDREHVKEPPNPPDTIYTLKFSPEEMMAAHFLIKFLPLADKT